MHSIFKVIGYNNATFQYKGRYAVLGNLDQSTKAILFAFHGQGQLTKYFIQKFKSLQAKGITIIAPEALHHYYLQGFSGRIGASWMTSENRLVAIENYITFLNSIYEDVTRKTSTDHKIYLLGFSQGAATVSRWIEQSSFVFQQLILWGGTLPPDLNEKLIFERMKEKEIAQIIGTNDPYINSSRVEEIKKLTNKYNLKTNYKFYDGGHEINEDVLMQLFEEL